MPRIGDRRPSRLGAFDEESCRFFLQELGESIVPYFPFYYGIEQVYECLLAKYGEEHVADAMSVLHELLEDDSVAIGIGDEGDAWRSWRYDWKHRNVDLFMMKSNDRISQLTGQSSRPFRSKSWKLPFPTSYTKTCALSQIRELHCFT